MSARQQFFPARPGPRIPGDERSPLKPESQQQQHSPDRSLLSSNKPLNIAGLTKRKPNPNTIPHANAFAAQAHGRRTPGAAPHPGHAFPPSNQPMNPRLHAPRPSSAAALFSPNSLLGFKPPPRPKTRQTHVHEHAHHEDELEVENPEAHIPQADFALNLHSAAMYGRDAGELQEDQLDRGDEDEVQETLDAQEHFARKRAAPRPEHASKRFKADPAPVSTSSLTALLRCAYMQPQPQTDRRHTPPADHPLQALLNGALISNRYAAAREKWANCDVDEWMSGADELTTRFAELIDIAKDHILAKTRVALSLDRSLEMQNSEMRSRDRVLAGAHEALVRNGGDAVGL